MGCSGREGPVDFMTCPPNNPLVQRMRDWRSCLQLERQRPRTANHRRLV